MPSSIWTRFLLTARSRNPNLAHDPSMGYTTVWSQRMLVSPDWLTEDSYLAEVYARCGALCRTVLVSHVVLVSFHVYKDTTAIHHLPFVEAGLDFFQCLACGFWHEKYRHDHSEECRAAKQKVNTKWWSGQEDGSGECYDPVDHLMSCQLPETNQSRDLPNLRSKRDYLLQLLFPGSGSRSHRCGMSPPMLR